MRRSEPGRPTFGILDEPVGPIQRTGFDLRKPTGGKAGWWARRFGFKHFQYMGAVSNELFVGCAIADTGFLTNVFAYVFDPTSGKMQERGWEAFLGKGFTYNPDPDSGVSHFEGKRGDVCMQAVRSAATGVQTKSLQVDFGNDFFIDMSFDDSPPYETMRICTQTGATGWTYA